MSREETTRAGSSSPTESQLDEVYRRSPFPSFAHWQGGEPVEEARRSDELSRQIDAEAANKGADALNRALEVTLRAAAVDTGALEGLYATNEGITMTIARRAAGWQATAEAKEILPFFEAQLAALEVIMELVAESKPLASLGVTEIAVKGLHRQITSAQTTYEVRTPAGLQRQDLPRGEYKRMPNHVKGLEGSFFSYAPVLDTASEMRRFVEELASEDFKVAPALVQAAYVHYALVRIHPFADGNGRLARALASLYLLRGYRVPLVVFSEDRAEYLQSLRSADEGRHQAFADFVGWAVVGSLELVLDEMQHGVHGSLDDQADVLNKLLEPERDQQAARIRLQEAIRVLAQETVVALEKVIDDARKRFAWTRFELSSRSFDEETILLTLTARVNGPEIEAEALIRLTIIPNVSEGHIEPMLRLGGSEPLEVEPARMLPSPDRRVVRRLRRWAEREFSRFIETLEERTRSRLGKPDA